MTTALLWATLLIAATVCALRLPMRHGYLTYPLLVAILYIAWIAPQLFAVMADPTLPREGLWALNVMVCLSLIAVIAGWSLGYRQAKAGAWRSNGAAPRASPPDSALFWPTAALTVIVIATRVMLAGMRIDPDLTSEWTGPIVIVVTVASVRIIPLFLSLAMVIRQRTPMTVGLAIANLLLSGSFAFVDIGRSETIDLVLVTFLALWFVGRVRIPMPVLAVGGVLVAIFVFTVGEFRTAAAANFEATGERASIFNPVVWRSIDFGEATTRAASGAPDIRNAVFIMAYRESEGSYTFGARLWNGLVFRWVPAQIVGNEIKDGLMIQKGQQEVYEEILNEYNYKRTGGTTSTGFGAAFTEFWYFGALLFGVYAWFAGRWWHLANRGDLWAQVMYSATLGSGLVNFTHNVYWVWLGMPLLLGGLLFVKGWIWAAHSARPGPATAMATGLSTAGASR